MVSSCPCPMAIFTGTLSSQHLQRTVLRRFHKICDTGGTELNYFSLVYAYMVDRSIFIFHLSFFIYRNQIYQLVSQLDLFYQSTQLSGLKFSKMDGRTNPFVYEFIFSYFHCHFQLKMCRHRFQGRMQNVWARFCLLRGEIHAITFPWLFWQFWLTTL